MKKKGDRGERKRNESNNNDIKSSNIICNKFNNNIVQIIRKYNKKIRGILNPMLNIIISLPILGIFLIQILEKREKIGRIIGMIITIITMYISLYMLLRMNNNNAEYQFRDFIDFEYIRLTLGVDGISMSLILVTTMLMPILILLKERKENNEINEIIKLLLVM